MILLYLIVGCFFCMESRNCSQSHMLHVIKKIMASSISKWKNDFLKALGLFIVWLYNNSYFLLLFIIAHVIVACAFLPLLQRSSCSSPSVCVCIFFLSQMSFSFLSINPDTIFLSSSTLTTLLLVGNWHCNDHSVVGIISLFTYAAYSINSPLYFRSHFSFYYVYVNWIDVC